MVRTIFDLIPSEESLDRRLCIASREVDLLQRLIRVARVADAMREVDAADRAALQRSEDQQTSEARKRRRRAP